MLPLEMCSANTCYFIISFAVGRSDDSVELKCL
jgi:hypothetical protein